MKLEGIPLLREMAEIERFRSCAQHPRANASSYSVEHDWVEDSYRQARKYDEYASAREKRVFRKG